MPRVTDKVVPTFYCDGKVVATSGQPIRCQQLQWHIDVVPRPALGIAPAAQNNIVSTAGLPSLW